MASAAAAASAAAGLEALLLTGLSQRNRNVAV
jgi:hypothetical protein